MGLTSSPLPQEMLSPLSTEEDLVAHLEDKQTQDPTLQISSVQACDNPSTDANDSAHDVPSEASLVPTLQISSVQACDNPSTDANDSIHDVPSEASLDIVQCAVCEMPCFDFMKYSVCNKFVHELCSKSEASNAT
jgi:hypothetical protein